jgi:short-subunit dehydrogenase involved in D-alanine esterification of teichoic acids
MIEEQGLDGIAHITYFDRQRQLSFTFDAKHGLVANVASGGYGEKPFAAIPVYNINYAQIAATLALFEQECKRFIATFEQYSEPEL